jgi:UDP-glucose:(heptosyl)LPS alpha-1,3-glucosyltransferase
VRSWRGSALSTVNTFPLGLRAQAAALGAYEIRHTQGYCGGEPNVVTAHICVAAYLKSLEGASLRNRLSLQLMAAAESRFYRRYRGRLIAVSRKVANELRELYGVRAPVRVVPHGVDPARFVSENRERWRSAVRRELSIADDAVVALYVGDLTKSHVYLKELSAAASAVQLVVVTASRAYHWRGANVRILPPTAKLERYYAAADAFVFPTTYDAFGMVVLEAMAAGLPVFSSDQAGAAELIHSGQDGFVIALSEWVAKTVAGLQDRNSLRKIGRAAAQTAQGYKWSSVVSAVEQVYQEVMG